MDRGFFKGTHEEIAFQNEQLMQTATEIEKYKTLSTLSSGLAHEVKNPLTAIKTFCEYLPKKMNDKKFLEDFARIVNVEVSRIDDLVHQLIDYSKPAPPNLKPTYVHKLIDDTLEFLNSRLLKNNIVASKNYEDGSELLIKIDPNQFRQALLNILLNAIEAMPSGGSLGIETRFKALGPRSLGSDKIQHPKSNTQDLESNTQNLKPNTLLISITDTGPGIPKKDLPKIFDPFFTQKDKGSGLGLSITRTIIEQHKGKISVKSVAGVGTEFVIELPLAPVVSN